MNIRKNSAKSTLVQIIIFLLVTAVLILINKSTIVALYNSGEISKTGLIINAIIIALFFLGLIRIVIVLVRYIKEHATANKMAEYLKDGANSPSSRLPANALIVQRFNAIKWVAKQGAPINQAAMAASSNAAESSRLTFVRFVHSTLILAGVFGTVVSLSMALIGAAGLLNSPEGVKEMGTIISSMSSALSSTVTAIVCFFVFAYFYLRLNDARVQMLSNIEDITSLHLLPKINHSEDGMLRQVTELTSALNSAADRLLMVEETFIKAGEGLQKVVNDLQGQVSNSSLTEIKELIRKGFHLSEPEYDAQPLQEKIAGVTVDVNDADIENVPVVTKPVNKPAAKKTATKKSATKFAIKKAASKTKVTKKK